MVPFLSRPAQQHTWCLPSSHTHLSHSAFCTEISGYCAVQATSVQVQALSQSLIHITIAFHCSSLTVAAAKGQEAVLASQQGKWGKATSLCIQVGQQHSFRGNMVNIPFSLQQLRQSNIKREILPMEGFAFPDRTGFV